MAIGRDSSKSSIKGSKPSDVTDKSKLPPKLSGKDRLRLLYYPKRVTSRDVHFFSSITIFHQTKSGSRRGFFYLLLLLLNSRCSFCLSKCYIRQLLDKYTGCYFFDINKFCCYGDFRNHKSSSTLTTGRKKE
jgi:hypothetical protein